MSQKRLDSFPFTENEAFNIAQKDLWKRVGTFCYPTRPRTHEASVEFEIWADIPRVRIDPQTGYPSGVRYLRFQDVGHVRVSLEKGTIAASLNWREAKANISEKLAEVDRSVEGALVRAAAKRFSQLPFSEHMHTPVVDILSNIVYGDVIDREAWAARLPDDDEGKFPEYVEMLTKADLVRAEGRYIRAGNVLLRIQERIDRSPDVVATALEHFFSVEDLDAVNRVIGPQLKLASKVYANAVEWEASAGISQDALRSSFELIYADRPKKALQFARYLMQLERLGIVRVQQVGGSRIIVPDETILANVRKSNSLDSLRASLVARRQ